MHYHPLPTSPHKIDGEDAHEDKIWSKRLRLVFASILFMTIGPSLILTNKHIMKTLHFHFPITLSSCGVFTTAVIVHAGFQLGCIPISDEVRKTVTWKYYAQRILPIGLLQALTLNFGNRVYLYLSVSIIQMLKAFTPVVTLSLLIVTRQEKIQMNLIGAVALLSFGTFVTAFGRSESDNSFLGFLYMTLAELAEATKLALKQMLLQGVPSHSGNKDASVEIVKFSVFETLYYYAPTAFLWSLVFSLPLEQAKLFGSFEDDEIAKKLNKMAGYGVDGDFVRRPVDVILAFPLHFLLAGLLGFGVNFGAFFLTKLVSGLFLKALVK